MMTANEISQQLAQRTEDIARYLLPNGKRDGNEWRAGSVNGEAGQSLGVHLNGEKSGVWSDFASGESGDLLDLWCATRKIKLAEAIKQAACYLGVSMPQFSGHRSLRFARPSQKYASRFNTTSPVMRYLMDVRKLTIETIQDYKIGEQSQKIVFPYWRDGELIFIKYLGVERINGKKQIAVEPNCEPCLFGWHLIPPNARSVTLCEGEIDAMTLHQYGFPALSVPFGGGSGNKHKWLEYEFDRLSIFDEIYLCFDNDIEGHAAVSELIDRLGRHRCRIVQLPHKDANACLQSGTTKGQFNDYIHNARSLDPDELKNASAFIEQVIDVFYPVTRSVIGYQAPWAKAQGKIVFRPEELSVWTGINGHGKSQFLGHVILHSMKNGARVCIASLELKPRRLLARLTRQAAGLALPSEEYVQAIFKWYEDKLWLFDLVGTAKTKRLLEVFLYARQRYGIDVFVIDSFMKLDIAEDDYKAQKSFIEQLCDFKNQHNCHIHIIVHPRKSADESMAPGKLDNKGTGAISDLADNCFTVWRNKKKEELLRVQLSGKNLTSDQLEKLNDVDSLWCCDKQRNGDWEGKIGLWFDLASFQYLNHAKQKPIQFVDYSNCVNDKQ